MRIRNSALLVILVLIIPVFIQVNEVESKPRAIEMIADGNYGYIMLSDDIGLYIVNLSDPSDPKFVSHLKLAGYSVSTMCVDNNYVYISCQLDYNPAQYAIHIIDVSTPEEPELVDTYVYSTQHFAHKISVSNDILLLIVNNILKIIDVSTPSSPSEVGFYSSHTVYDISAAGNRAYITCGEDGLKILDITTPSSPVVLGGNVNDSFYDLYVDGYFAFLPINDAVLRLDVTIPSAIVPAGIYPLDYYTAMRISDGFLFYVTGFSLYIVDFTDASPSLESIYYIGQNYYYRFDVHGDYVYCLSYEISIIDITDSSTPVEVGLFELWFPSIRTRNIILGAVALTIVATMIVLIVWRRDKIKASIEHARAQRVITTQGTKPQGKMYKAVKISLIVSVSFFVASLSIIIGVASWNAWIGIFLGLFLGSFSIAALCLGPLITWTVVRARKKSVVQPIEATTQPIVEEKRERQEGMIFCPSCGKQISAEQKHCSKCGYKM